MRQIIVIGMLLLSVEMALSSAAVAQSGNTAYGAAALQSNKAGNYNSGFGAGALGANTAGNMNTAAGFYALSRNTTGSENTAIGMEALLNNTTGSQNVALDSFALWANTTGVDNLAIGYQALYTSSTASQNMAIGLQSMQFFTSGIRNVGLGMSTMPYMTIGNNNTGLGFEANYSIGGNPKGGGSNCSENPGGSCDGNTAIGTNALTYNTGGSYNTAVGFEAIFGGSGADYPSFIPNYGANNTGVGYQAMYALQNGNYNSAFGVQALADLSNGLQNVAVGYNTGRGITSGSYNTIIGGNVSGLPASLSNNVIIADGQGNKRITVDNLGRVSIPGMGSAAQANVICFNNANGLLTYQIWAAGCGVSSVRYKDHVVSLSAEESLDIALGLSPVSFRYKPESDLGSEEHLGFTAEQVQSIDPRLVTYELDGRPRAVKYQEIAPILVGAIQRLKNDNDQLRVVNSELNARLERLESLARLDKKALTHEQGEPLNLRP